MTLIDLAQSLAGTGCIGSSCDYKLNQTLSRHSLPFNLPSWILENISQNWMWNVAVVITHPDIRSPYIILFRNGPDSVDQLVLI